MFRPGLKVWAVLFGAAIAGFHAASASATSRAGAGDGGCGAARIKTGRDRPPTPAGLRAQCRAIRSCRALAHGASSTLFIGTEQAVLSVAGARPGQGALKSARQAAGIGSALRIRYLGANGDASVEGREALSARVNYFIGRDPRRWRIGIPTWRSVIARNVWRGIDLSYNGNRGNLECDFEIAPGADASAIRLALQGAERVRITHGGDLTMLVGGRAVTFLKPRAFARAGGAETDVRAGFVIHPQASGRDRLSVGPVEVGFEVAGYDHRAPLVIDPTLVYSS